MKNKVLVITIIVAISLVIGGSITVFAEEANPEDGKGTVIDRSIFEPFREKIEALKLKREEVRTNREQVKAFHEEWKTEIEEFKANREAFKENPEMLNEDQKAELKILLESLRAEDGARKTLIETRGIQMPRLEAIRSHRESFKAEPNDEDLDSIDVLYDEIIGTQQLRITLFPEALDLIKAVNEMFDTTL